MIVILYIALGGAIGSFLRFLICKYGGMYINTKFPYPVFIINFLGCFVIGICANISNTNKLSSDFKDAIVIGFCGGFTTWSTFASQTVNLIIQKDNLYAVLNVLCNHVFGGLFYYLGYLVANKINLH